MLHYRKALKRKKVQICTKCEVSGDEVPYRVLYGLWRHVIEQAGEGVRYHIRISARTPATRIDRFFVTPLGSLRQIAERYVEQARSLRFQFIIHIPPFDVT
jgi:hypothetical protein